jgi:simple sugar transport system permease protein
VSGPSSVDKREPAGVLSRARGQLFAAVRLFGGLAALVVIGIMVSPRARDGSIIFLQPDNLFDVLARVSNVGILAVGMTLVIITGGIDLSVGSVLSLGTVIAALLLLERGWNPAVGIAVPALALVAGAIAAVVVSKLLSRRASGSGPAVGAFVVVAALIGWLAASIAPHGFPVPLVVLSVTAIGLLVGALNGALVAYGGLQPFIATLATMIGAWGLAWLIPGEANARRHISTGEADYAMFNWLGSRIAKVPVPGLFFITILLIAHWLLRSTSLGRRLYAIGGNEEATRLSGVAVDCTKVLVYGVSGLLAAFTGTLWAAQYHQGFPDAGREYELNAIAAVVIGGTSLMGGRGGVLGTFMGVLMFGVLNNILTLLQYSTNWQRIVTGAIIVAAVLLQGPLRDRILRMFWRGLLRRVLARIIGLSLDQG